MEIMNGDHKAIRESHFVLKSMQRIALDTIEPMKISKDYRYILVIIDNFTRYVR